MRPRLHDVLRRGAIFIWHRYTELDDAAYAGSFKPKFIVVISSSPLDDPILYILTTSEKTDDKPHPFPNDILVIPQGRYVFFPKTTLVDVGGAGDRDVDLAGLEKLYARGDIDHVGHLMTTDVEALMTKVSKCFRVRRVIKQILGLG